MDIDLFSTGEQFSTFDNHFLDGSYPDDSASLDSVHGFTSDLYEWHNMERELNGDIALIPMSSGFGPSSMDSITEPPTSDFNSIINWLNTDEDLATIHSETDENIFELNIDEDELTHVMRTVSELTTINDTPTPPPPLVTKKRPPVGKKKIDLKAQCYIVEEEGNENLNVKQSGGDEEDHVDVETVSEGENSPVLEAGDLNSLLEQFEATELPDVSLVENIRDERVKLCSIEEDVNVQKEIKEESKTTQIIAPKPIQYDLPPIPQNKVKQQEQKKLTPPTNSPLLQTPSTDLTTSDKNKQILESLPQELIARIKESSKRKPISLIPAIPTNNHNNKKRTGARILETAQPRNKIIKLEHVHFDHDYCTQPTPYPKHPKKDSGFESAEEDDFLHHRAASIKNQPIVKNTDGKLMVSLLKVNTIRTDDVKKRLNLDEYKKRREGILSKSQCNSPLNSTCSSPLPEDEFAKIVKHQEKLKKMAKEVLNTPPPKCEKPDDVKSVVVPLAPPPPRQIVIPADMERKTLVSIGVNTDDTMNRPVEQLEEIKPLLQKASAKINSNSLITSLIENIPKVKVVPTMKSGSNNEHGEDKTIVYLPKNRILVKTRTVEVQTNLSLILSKPNRYRRRNSSDSSTSSRDGGGRGRSVHYNSRRRKDSESSVSSSDHSSRSSSSSSSYSSPSRDCRHTNRSDKRSYRSRSTSSRSRSPSPHRHRQPSSVRRKPIDPQRLKEVEERRVIYIGRISSSTTKTDLQKRFQRFGVITHISLHFRGPGYLDNYGFVTFANKFDAWDAFEHGNDDPFYPKYDLSFGGRRLFCQTSYSDLDNMREDSNYSTPQAVTANDSFDKLLWEVKEKLRKRKV